jgi:hypothetical protein
MNRDRRSTILSAYATLFTVALGLTVGGHSTRQKTSPRLTAIHFPAAEPARQHLTSLSTLALH